MKTIMVTNSRLAKLLRVGGIVLYPFVFFADKNPAPSVVSHELIHIKQIRQSGVLLFYFQYAREYVLNRWHGMNHHEAYLAISFEKEAYAGQEKYA